MNDAREPEASSDRHVIFGTGPVGCWTARALVANRYRVRAVNRSDHRPGLLPDDVDVRAVDASDPAQARAAAEGATTIVQALNPTYHRWHELFPALQANALAAAEAAASEMIAMAAEAAGVAPKASGMGRLMMRLGGLFIPVARATVEMMDQFLKPFVVDAHVFEHAFGRSATPLREGLARTVTWHRTRSG